MAIRIRCVCGKKLQAREGAGDTVVCPRCGTAMPVSSVTPSPPISSTAVREAPDGLERPSPAHDDPRWTARIVLLVIVLLVALTAVAWVTVLGLGWWEPPPARPEWDRSMAPIRPPKIVLGEPREVDPGEEADLLREPRELVEPGEEGVLLHEPRELKEKDGPP
jgi:hypothetical protein